MAYQKCREHRVKSAFSVNSRNVEPGALDKSMITYDMVSEGVIPPTSNEKSHFVHPPTHQPPTPDDNILSLFIARESSILKLNRFICLIIWRGG